MLNLENLFRNFFDLKNLSNESLEKFASDHIDRLQANAPLTPSFVGGTVEDELHALKLATKNLYEPFYASLSSEHTNMAYRKTATLSTDELLDQFKDMVTRREGLIRSKFNVGTVPYLDFFPQGVTEYRRATKKNAKQLMEHFSTVCTKYATEIGTDMVTEASNIFAAYVAARTAQQEQKGVVSDIKDDKGDFRSALEIQLCKNIHVIGALFPTDVHKCMKFFDQSIIRTEHNYANDGIGRAVGTITGNGMPVVGATVSYVGMNMPVVHSKADGTYKGRNVPIGMHQVEVSAPGFQTFTTSINVVDDGDTELNVALQAVAG